jgi:membrane protein implicated in regulation of membrane protease activity
MITLLVVSEYIVFIWFGVIILATVIEASTMDLSSIWFSVGALIALIASAFGANEVVQMLLFIVVSAGLLIGLRPLFKKYVKRNNSSTNVDSLIGKTAVCLKGFSDGVRGEVKIDGKIWTAISKDTILVNDKVTVLAIEGVKLVVQKNQ